MNTTKRTSGAVRKEIEKLQREMRELEKLEAEERAQKYFENLDLYLKIAEHVNHRCDDITADSPHHCVRCKLLQIQRDGYWPAGFSVRLMC